MIIDFLKLQLARKGNDGSARGHDANRLRSGVSEYKPLCADKFCLCSTTNTNSLSKSFISPLHPLKLLDMLLSSAILVLPALAASVSGRIVHDVGVAMQKREVPQEHCEWPTGVAANEGLLTFHIQHTKT